MRYDLNILWIEDTPTWMQSVEKNLLIDFKTMGINVKFDHVSNGDIALQIIEDSSKGFKKYDLFFVDFNISSDNVNGEKIIKSLRNNDIDVDILFYSAQKEKEIKDKIKSEILDFQGIYVCNRNNFIEKVLFLIKKNSRNQLSIKNIRGMIMDNTAENDFVVNSYLLLNYDRLEEADKDFINKKVINYFNANSQFNSDELGEKIKILKEKGIIRIKDFLKMESFFVPLELRYLILLWMLTQTSKNEKYEEGFKAYKEKIISKRNILAHKKLEICDQYTHIKYCNDYNQYVNRECKNLCGECSQDNKISLEEWDKIRREVIDSSNMFDEILENIKSE